MDFADQQRLFGMAVAEGWRRVRRLLGGGRGRIRIAGPPPERLVLAPQDLHTSDPTVAQEIYSGLFHLAGRSVSVDGKGVFRTHPPSPEWERMLHGFGWLRHLGATGNAVSTNNAQALVQDWIDTHPRPRNSPAWDPEVAAKRLISWLCHSVMIVEGAEMRSWRRFMKSVGQHIRFLRAATSDAPEGMPQLVCLIALAYGDVCVAGPRFGMRQAQRNLDAELARQILPDGGHISRNPEALPELLALLLPLRQSFARLGQAPSNELVSAIDRMMLALRFFSHVDGSLARFNGMGPTPFDLAATVLRYDESLGEPPRELPMSGYQRLQAGDAVVIMDVGKPAGGELSALAHAGTLAFEMSSADGCFIVNCGVPPAREGEAAKAGRATAAHSTATVDDTSSSRFAGDGMMGRLLEGRIVHAPSKVLVSRKEDEGGSAVEASHDGYMRGFGLLHERRLELSVDGGKLSGTDRFLASPAGRASDGKHGIAIRFHLHPSCEIVESEEEGITILRNDLPCWVFRCESVRPVVEESIFFAVPDGARHSLQIVLHLDSSQGERIDWHFEKAG